jgi:hypothetical protein
MGWPPRVSARSPASSRRLLVVHPQRVGANEVGARALYFEVVDRYRAQRPLQARDPNARPRPRDDARADAQVLRFHEAAAGHMEGMLPGGLAGCLRERLCDSTSVQCARSFVPLGWPNIQGL